MPDNEALNSVLASNRQLRRQAMALNARAGAAVFPVMTEEELQRWVAGRLSGATGVASIDPETLRLPPLDPALIEQVERENPTVIHLGIEAVLVDYQTGQPVVTIDYKSIALRALPADLIRLPGGRPVAVRIQFGSWGISNATPDLGLFRMEVNEAARKAHWKRWSRPAVTVPAFETEPLPLPPLREEVFGSDPLTGDRLLAWGAFTWSAETQFTMQWFQDRDAAEAARELARQRMEDLHAGWRDTSPARRTPARPATPVPASPPPSPRVAVPFSAELVPWFRSEPSLAWVIRADGTRRDPDRTVYHRRYEPEGTLFWDDVTADEIAVRWWVDASGEHFEVALRPRTGITAAQLAALNEIETENGLPPGSFGLGPADVAHAPAPPRRRRWGWGRSS